MTEQLNWPEPGKPGAGGAAPAGGLANHPREARVAVRFNYVELPSMAGRGTDERWAKARGIKDRDGPSPTPEVRLPEPKIAAVERRRACASVVSFANDAEVARRLRDKRRHACRAVRISC